MYESNKKKLAKTAAQNTCSETSSRAVSLLAAEIVAKAEIANGAQISTANRSNRLLVKFHSGSNSPRRFTIVGAADPTRPALNMIAGMVW